jgi:ribosomal protein S18 acetylase RimI-like enzyme
VDLARDTCVVLADGEVIGFLMTHHDGLSGPLTLMGRTHPAHVGRGLGTWFVERAIQQALERGVGSVRTMVPREDRAGRSLLDRAGFTQVRTSFDMGADLTGQERAPRPPHGVTVRPFVRGRDDRAVWELENAAFRDHWDHLGDIPFEMWESDWFSDGEDPAAVVLAETDGRPVGEVAWAPVEGGAYILSVATLAPYRRRGIAGALLRQAIADIAAAGHRHVYLSVDASSPTGAVGVYEGAGLAVLRTADVFDRVVP